MRHESEPPVCILAIGDIAPNTNQADILPLVILEWQFRGEQPTFLTFAVDKILFLVEHRLASFDNRTVIGGKRGRDIRREQIKVVLAQNLGFCVQAHVMNVGEIRKGLATGPVLGINRIGQIINQYPEKALSVPELVFSPLAFGDVLHNHQGGIAFVVLEFVRRDLHFNDATVLQRVAPMGGVLQWPVLRCDGGDQSRHVFRRTNILQRQFEELFLRVTVFLDCCSVHFEEGERLEIVHPHREWVIVEQKAESFHAHIRFRL